MGFVNYCLPEDSPRAQACGKRIVKLMLDDNLSYTEADLALRFARDYLCQNTRPVEIKEAQNDHQS